MPERPDTDEVTRLRAADPVHGMSMPEPSDANGRALFQRITSSNGATNGDGRQTPAGHRVLLVAAGIAVLALLGGGVVSLLRTDRTDVDIAGIQPTPTPMATTATAGPITPGGAVGSCVEVYDKQTLANRELAFDGTLKRVNGDRATFSVNEWYRGGDSDEVTLAGAATFSGITSAGPAVMLEPGTRLLVAGDGQFVWSCGFTQPYNASVARQWQDIFDR